jgi:ABC-2 type transport system ATP-binding protein
MTLEVANLGKRFGNTWALRNIDFTLDSGVIGLLGPNGAGKSTLMRLVTTFVKPTEGTVYWNGMNVFDEPNVIRSAVGYLPQTFGVYPSLTAREFLSYLAGIRGVGDASNRIDDLLRLVNLGDAADDRLGGFSGGMRQRVGIAQALLSDPDLLVVDEPTVGLDPEERVRFRNVLADLGEDRGDGERCGAASRWAVSGARTAKHLDRASQRHSMGVGRSGFGRPCGQTDPYYQYHYTPARRCPGPSHRRNSAGCDC